MQRDWNTRALLDSEHFVYTRDSAADEADFAASGRANYDQLVRPYLPLLLHGAAPPSCSVLEIGCGVGRMTRWFAENFGTVYGIDVSPEMIRQARQRLSGYSHVTLHTGSGFDLAPLPDAHFDLVFSYIVFQHIPSAAVIRHYIVEAARVLKPGGAFKFQVNGDQSPAYLAHVRDTWQGETFSCEEVESLLREAGLSLETVEEPGTQYFVVTARKGMGPDRRTYYLPGEPHDGGWRPVPPQSSLTLLSTPGKRLYAGLYFWPADPHPAHAVTVTVNGSSLGAQWAKGPGDHFLEWSLPETNGTVAVHMAITPPCEQPHWPALRIVGIG